MIVKVQLSLAGSEPEQKVLIYNQDRSKRQEEVASLSIKKLMRGRAKAFFHAHLNKGKFILDGEALRQEW